MLIFAERPLVFFLQFLLGLLLEAEHQPQVLDLVFELSDLSVSLVYGNREFLPLVLPLDLLQLKGRLLLFEFLDLFQAELVFFLESRILLLLVFQLVLGGHIGLGQSGHLLLDGVVLADLELEVVIEFLVLDGEFAVNAVYFVDFVFELEPEGDFLVEGLFCLLEVLHEYVLVVFEVGVVFAEFLELFENPGVFFLVDFFVVVDDALPLLDLVLHAVHLLDLVALNLGYHRLEVPVRTVLQQYRVHLPERLPDVHVLPPDLLQQRIEPHRVHKQRLEYPIQVLRVYSFR